MISLVTTQTDLLILYATAGIVIVNVLLIQQLNKFSSTLGHHSMIIEPE